MSINLLELMQGALSNQVVGKISGLLGVDEGNANKAIGGALPALLAGFIGKASTSEGAEQLGAVLDQADGTILDNIGDILDGADGGADRLQEMGNGLIGGLFGDKVGGLVELLSGTSGLGKDKTGSLLGIIAPIIFSLLGKQKKSLGLDGAGFAKLLLGQKDLLKGVLPPGLSGALGLSGFEGDTNIEAATENLKDAVVNAAAEKAEEGKAAATEAMASASEKFEEVRESAASAVGAAIPKPEAPKETSAASTAPVSEPAPAPQQPVVAEKASGGFGKVLFPILILAILGFAVWKYFLSQPSAADIKLPAPSELNAGNAVSAMNGVIAKAKASLKSIDDVESAKVAASELNGLTNQVGNITGKISGLPDGVKAQLKQAVVKFAPQFNDLVEKAYGIPGVKPVLEPAVDNLISKLEIFG
ncbi:MAG: DUF937 domain-containing protein [Verrucomicrobiales bacterium]|nr:DUF937 domain-containing protein [Verrucomicrobiales bacterium]